MFPVHLTLHFLSFSYFNSAPFFPRSPLLFSPFSLSCCSCQTLVLSQGGLVNHTVVIFSFFLYDKAFISPLATPQWSSGLFFPIYPSVSLPLAVLGDWAVPLPLSQSVCILRKTFSFFHFPLLTWRAFSVSAVLSYSWLKHIWALYILHTKGIHKVHV